MRPAVAAIFERLLVSAGPLVSLDAIGEAIGVEQISPSEIEELFEALEAAGREIDSTAPNIRLHLALVLREARRLRSQQASSPSVTSLAEATKLTEREVRAALLYASVLGR